tara:strand:+ start:2386 stop:3117 length:732 start_codon:yes stop_codon:yes gene_type:complete
MDSKKEFLIYGKRAIYEALENNVEIDKIFIQKNNQHFDGIKSKIHKKKINISFVPVQKLNKLTSNNHQGIVATISPIKTKNLHDLEREVKKNSQCLILILDGITDTKNFGAIVRSAECFGVDFIVISKSGNSPINGETIKSSSGAIFNVPICKVDHIKDAIYFLKEFGIKIIGSDDKGSKNLFKHNFEEKCAIIMGSEGDGIKKSILNLCDDKINIPLYGKLSSLNVSVATGIFLSEFKRQQN